MASGVAVCDEAKEAYQAVKMNVKGKKKAMFVVYKLSDDNKEIVVDTEFDLLGEKEEEGGQCVFQQLIRSLPDQDGRYILFDYPYDGSFGPASKLILVLWCPTNIPIKKKMLYASSKDALKRVCQDLGGEFQADCCDDLCHRDIEQKLKKV